MDKKDQQQAPVQGKYTAWVARVKELPGFPFWADVAAHGFDARAFFREGAPTWQEIRDQLEAEWKEEEKSLDAETEQAISQTLSELEGDVTTVTVAHRLATVRFVDQLLYLKHGRVIARGTFDSIRHEVPDFDRQASLLGL